MSHAMRSLTALALLAGSIGCKGGGGDGDSGIEPEPAPGDPIITADRRIDWSPGIPGGIPTYPVFASVKDAPYDAAGDGAADDTAAIQRAIDDCPAGRAVYLPEGDYRTTAALLVLEKGIVLRGAGPGKTRIQNGGLESSIRIYRAPSGTAGIPIVSGHVKGSVTITVSDASSLVAGSYLVLSQRNQPGLVFNQGSESVCTWCGDDDPERTMTQVVQITAKAENTLTIHRPLYFTFLASLDPQARKLELAEGAGVEDLSVEQTNPNGGNGHNVAIQQFARSWVRNVESRMPWNAHIRLKDCYGCEIRENVCDDGWDHGGGRAYGIHLFTVNSDHLIENNAIRRARHSLIFEGGGSGCVLGYNYCVEVTSEPGVGSLSSDAVTHGTHPYMNLFEGNVFAKLAFDNTFASGSHNTALRNHMVNASPGVTRGRWAVDIQAQNYYHNLVGNVIGQPGDAGSYEPTSISSDATLVTYRLGYWASSAPSSTDPQVAATLLRHGNFDFVSGETKWEPHLAARELPASLYRVSKPAFFGDQPWPLIGPDVPDLIGGQLPAQERLEAYLAR